GELERCRVDTIAQTGRRGTVTEDVAEVGIAVRAVHLDAPHPVAAVLLGRDAFLAQRLPEARPARPGFELGVGAEEILTAADALVSALPLEVVVLPRESALRALLARHGELLRRELPLPLLLALDNL